MAILSALSSDARLVGIKIPPIPFNLWGRDGNESDIQNKKFYPILSIVRAQRGALVESSTALAIAGLLIAEIQGQEELNFYEPLTVIEETDQWVVQGVAADPRYRGMIALAKADCQIVGLDFEMPMERLEEAD